MGSRKRTGQLNGNVQGQRRWQLAAAQARPQSDPIDKLGGDVVLAFELAYIMNRENVWVVECRGGKSFPSEPQASFVVTLTILRN